ncbi:MAG TPA: hypothetical protein VGD78_20480 [Chthoniobacterales bacterium]
MNPSTRIRAAASPRAFTLYTLACDDSAGLQCHLFTGEAQACAWLAERAEGPASGERAALHRCLARGDLPAFWRAFADLCHPEARYALTAHPLQAIQPELPNLF